MLNFRRKIVASHLRKDSLMNTANQILEKIFLNLPKSIQNVDANVNTRLEFSISCSYFFENACSKTSLED